MLYQTLLLLMTLVTPPLQLQWDQPHDRHPEVSKYRYYYGDVSWGTVVYLGTEDVVGLESELQLYYSGKTLAKATLILGPLGLDTDNCVSKYRMIISLLEEKYGKHNRQVIEKDPLLYDMIYSATCRPILIGMYTVDTYWTRGGYSICASLFGDGEIYIEIEYAKKSVKFTPKTRKKALKRL